MSTQKGTKINKLLQSQPYGTVFTSSWMTSQGYSPELQRRYKSSHWLQSIGTGVMKRIGDEINIEGAMYALQEQLNLAIHIGGKSSLAMTGKLHYLEMGKTEVIVFSSLTERLPK